MSRAEANGSAVESEKPTHPIVSYSVAGCRRLNRQVHCAAQQRFFPQSPSRSWKTVSEHAMASEAGGSVRIPVDMPVHTRSEGFVVVGAETNI